MKRAYSVANVLNAKFNVLDFEGKWLDSIGKPELTGTWTIYGGTKNGKTSCAFQLGKYLTDFGRVAYNSVEEGLVKTIQDIYRREKMEEVAGKFILLNKENISEMYERLMKRKSPHFIFVDTVQFWDLKFSDYKMLKHDFSKKLIIYLSHTDGNLPEGTTALKILRDSSVAIRVEGFMGFVTSRYGGGKPYMINEKLASEYWGDISKF